MADWIHERMLHSDRKDVVGFIDGGFNESNTQMKSLAEYESDPFVTGDKRFHDINGNFDHSKFNSFYQNELSSYNRMCKQDRNEDWIGMLDFEYGSGLATEHGNVKPAESFAPTIEFKSNPMAIVTNGYGLGYTRESQFSKLELAEDNLQWDSNLNQFVDSPNDNVFDTLFGASKVMAQWDEDGYHKDLLTGQMVEHSKGEYKIGANGRYYFESLDGRDPYGRTFLNRFSTITTDGSKYDKYAFWDHDDKVKSGWGTTAYVAANLLPMFITGPIGGFIKGSMILYSTLDILGKTTAAISDFGSDHGWWSNDHTMVNNYMGFFRSMDRQTSEYSQNKFMTYENLGNFVIDIFQQLEGQAQLTKWISHGMPNFAINTNIAKYYKDEKAFRAAMEAEYYAQGEALHKAGGGIAAGLSKTNIEDIAKFETMANVRDLVKKWDKVGEIVGRTYMTGLVCADYYNEARKAGASADEAALFALAYSVGEFALLSTDIAKRTLPHLRMRENNYEDLAKGFLGVLKTEKQHFDAVGGSAAGAEAKKGWFKHLWTNLCDGVVKNKGPFAQGALAAFSSGIGEGLEEVAEEGLADVIKYVENTFNKYILDNDTQRFDITSNMLERYLMNFAGGMLGGAAYNFSPNYKYFKNDHISNEIKFKESAASIVDLWLNGRIDEFMEVVNKTKFGPDNLSNLTTKLDSGEIVNILAGDGVKSINQEAHERINDFISMIGNVMQTHNLMRSKNQLTEEIMKVDMRYINFIGSKSFDTYFSEYNNSVVDIANDEAKIQEKISSMSGKTGAEKDSIQGQLDSLRAQQKAKAEALHARYDRPVDEFGNAYGMSEAAREYAELSVWEMTNGPALFGSTLDVNHLAELMAGKPWIHLTEDEKKNYLEKATRMKSETERTISTVRETFNMSKKLLKTFASNGTDIFNSLHDEFGIDGYASRVISDSIMGFYQGLDMNIDVEYAKNHLGAKTDVEAQIMVEALNLSKNIAHSGLVDIERILEAAGALNNPRLTTKVRDLIKTIGVKNGKGEWGYFDEVAGQFVHSGTEWNEAVEKKSNTFEDLKAAMTENDRITDESKKRSHESIFNEINSKADPAGKIVPIYKTEGGKKVLDYVAMMRFNNLSMVADFIERINNNGLPMSAFDNVKKSILSNLDSIKSAHPDVASHIDAVKHQLEGIKTDIGEIEPEFLEKISRVFSDRIDSKVDIKELISKVSDMYKNGNSDVSQFLNESEQTAIEELFKAISLAKIIVRLTATGGPVTTHYNSASYTSYLNDMARAASGDESVEDEYLTLKYEDMISVLKYLGDVEDILGHYNGVIKMFGANKLKTDLRSSLKYYCNMKNNIRAVVENLEYTEEERANAGDSDEVFDVKKKAIERIKSKFNDIDNPPELDTLTREEYDEYMKKWAEFNAALFAATEEIFYTEELSKFRGLTSEQIDALSEEERNKYIAQDRWFIDKLAKDIANNGEKYFSNDQYLYDGTVTMSEDNDKLDASGVLSFLYSRALFSQSEFDSYLMNFISTNPDGKFLVLETQKEVLYQALCYKRFSNAYTNLIAHIINSNVFRIILEENFNYNKKTKVVSISDDKLSKYNDKEIGKERPILTIEIPGRSKVYMQVDNTDGSTSPAFDELNTAIENWNSGDKDFNFDLFTYSDLFISIRKNFPIVYWKQYNDFFLIEGAAGTGKSSAILKFITGFYANPEDKIAYVHSTKTNAEKSLSNIGVKGEAFDKSLFLDSILEEEKPGDVHLTIENNEIVIKDASGNRVEKVDSLSDHFSFDNLGYIKLKGKSKDNASDYDMVILDEFTLFSDVELNSIRSHYVNHIERNKDGKHFSPIFVLGDLDQNTISGKISDKEQHSWEFDLRRSQFVGSPKMVLSMRADNFHKCENNNAFLSYIHKVNDYIDKGKAVPDSLKLQIRCAINDDGFYGDMIRFTERPSGNIDDIKSELFNVADKMIHNIDVENDKGNNEKIVLCDDVAYYTGHSGVTLEKEFREHYGDSVFDKYFVTMDINNSQGTEALYYISRVGGIESAADASGLNRLINTTISRAKRGSYVIARSGDDQIKEIPLADGSDVATYAFHEHVENIAPDNTTVTDNISDTVRVKHFKDSLLTLINEHNAFLNFIDNNTKIEIKDTIKEDEKKPDSPESAVSPDDTSKPSEESSSSGEDGVLESNLRSIFNIDDFFNVDDESSDKINASGTSKTDIYAHTIGDSAVGNNSDDADYIRKSLLYIQNIQNKGRDVIDEINVGRIGFLCQMFGMGDITTWMDKGVLYDRIRAALLSPGTKSAVVKLKELFGENIDGTPNVKFMYRSFERTERQIMNGGDGYYSLDSDTPCTQFGSSGIYAEVTGFKNTKGERTTFYIPLVSLPSPTNLMADLLIRYGVSESVATRLRNEGIAIAKTYTDVINNFEQELRKSSAPTSDIDAIIPVIRFIASHYYGTVHTTAIGTTYTSRSLSYSDIDESDVKKWLTAQKNPYVVKTTRLSDTFTYFNSDIMHGVDLQDFKKSHKGYTFSKPFIADRTEGSIKTHHRYIVVSMDPELDLNKAASDSIIDTVKTTGKAPYYCAIIEVFNSSVDVETYLNYLNNIPARYKENAFSPVALFGIFKYIGEQYVNHGSLNIWNPPTKENPEWTKESVNGDNLLRSLYAFDFMKGMTMDDLINLFGKNETTHSVSVNLDSGSIAKDSIAYKFFTYFNAYTEGKIDKKYLKSNGDSLKNLIPAFGKLNKYKKADFDSLVKYMKNFNVYATSLLSLNATSISRDKIRGMKMKNPVTSQIAHVDWNMIMNNYNSSTKTLISVSKPSGHASLDLSDFITLDSESGKIFYQKSLGGSVQYECFLNLDGILVKFIKYKSTTDNKWHVSSPLYSDITKAPDIIQTYADIINKTIISDDNKTTSDLQYQQYNKIHNNRYYTNSLASKRSGTWTIQTNFIGNEIEGKSIIDLHSILRSFEVATDKSHSLNIDSIKAMILTAKDGNQIFGSTAVLAIASMSKRGSGISNDFGMNIIERALCEFGFEVRFGDNSYYDTANKIIYLNESFILDKSKIDKGLVYHEIVHECSHACTQFVVDSYLNATVGSDDTNWIYKYDSLKNDAEKVINLYDTLSDIWNSLSRENKSKIKIGTKPILDNERFMNELFDTSNRSVQIHEFIASFGYPIISEFITYISKNLDSISEANKKTILDFISSPNASTLQYYSFLAIRDLIFNKNVNLNIVRGVTSSDTSTLPYNDRLNEGLTKLFDDTSLGVSNDNITNIFDFITTAEDEGGMNDYVYDQLDTNSIMPKDKIPDTPTNSFMKSYLLKFFHNLLKKDDSDTFVFEKISNDPKYSGKNIKDELLSNDNIRKVVDFINNNIEGEQAIKCE